MITHLWKAPFHFYWTFDTNRKQMAIAFDTNRKQMAIAHLWEATFHFYWTFETNGPRLNTPRISHTCEIFAKFALEFESSVIRLTCLILSQPLNPLSEKTNGTKIHGIEDPVIFQVHNLSEWVSSGLTPCRQLRPSSRREHFNASGNQKLFVKACTAQVLSRNLKSLPAWQS